MRRSRKRSGRGVLVATFVLLLSGAAGAQSLDIVPPAGGFSITLSYNAAAPQLVSAPLDIPIAVTLPEGTTGQVHVYLNDEPMRVVALPTSVVTLPGVPAGMNTLLLRLADDAGTEYPWVYQYGLVGEETEQPGDVTRISVSRVCWEDAECGSPDPCFRGDCIGEVDVGGGWYGHCRLGLDWSNTDCCINDGSCLAALRSYDGGLPGVCVDVDGDGLGECIECTVDADCPPRANWSCYVGRCENEAYGYDYCVYDEIPGCCIFDEDCQDQWPELVGECAAHQCSYRPNPAYCRSPLDTVVINEIVLNPADADDVSGELMELYNPTGERLSLDGWTLDNGQSGRQLRQGEFVCFSDDEDDSDGLPAGGHALVFGRPSPSEPGDYVHVPHGVWCFYGDELDPWPTEGGTIVLRDEAGAVQDEIHYDSSWGFEAGRPMALLHPYLDNAQATNWRQVQVLRSTLSWPNTNVWDPTLAAVGPCSDGEVCTLDLCHEGEPNVCGHIRIPDCCLGPEDRCDDYNSCTVDGCDTDAQRCQHLRIPGCCRWDMDCDDWLPDDLDPTQAEAFAACAETMCVGHHCVWARRPDTQGCCLATDAALLGCDDRNPCTRDACVAQAGLDGEGVPYPRCVFTGVLDDESPGECCLEHEDCRSAERHPEWPCREGTCEGFRCRFGPFDEDCCLTDDDCTAGACEEVHCNADNRCEASPVPGCCRRTDDCPQPGDGSHVAACVDGQCTEMACPQHCENDNPEGADLSCDDGNPCTEGWCLPSGACHACRTVPLHGVGCCVADADCPPDGVACTQERCEGAENRCVLDPVADCVARLPYAMDFQEGRVCYAGQYERLDDIGWSLSGEGLGAAFDSTFLLGPDPQLLLRPTGRAAYDGCVHTPVLATAGLTGARLRFSLAAEAEAQFSVAAAGTLLQLTLDGTTLVTSHELTLSAEDLAGETPRLSFCVAGDDAGARLSLDDVRIEPISPRF